MDASIVRIENLHAYLEERGFEVVSGHWLRGEHYPVLFIRPIAQPKAAPDLLLPPRCRCGHGLANHDGQSACLVAGCACRVYDPRKD